MIIIEGTDVESKDAIGQDQYQFNMDMRGDPLKCFHLLCEAIHSSPQFKAMVTQALKYDNEHDRANCPYCNTGTGN
jgi:hypothetical protein